MSSFACGLPFFHFHAPDEMPNTSFEPPAVKILSSLELIASAGLVLGEMKLVALAWEVEVAMLSQSSVFVAKVTRVNVPEHGGAEVNAPLEVREKQMLESSVTLPSSWKTLLGSSTP